MKKLIDNVEYILKWYPETRDDDRKLYYTLITRLYNASELTDILDERIKMAFEDRAVMPETLQLICEIATERGDARDAIELLWRAGKQADSVGSSVILPDYAR